MFNYNSVPSTVASIETMEVPERIKEVGYEKWYTEMVERASCAECHTLNSAYDMACRMSARHPVCATASDSTKQISNIRRK